MLLVLVRLIIFFVFTLSLLPFQVIIIFFLKKFVYIIPKFYHIICCKILGIKIKKTGKISDSEPTFFVSNHASYLDIIILSSLFKSSFLAKKEISSWPLFGILAKLQNTVFIDRKIGSIKEQENLIINHLKSKNNLVIFPEGTSSNGNQVLPFKSPLFNIFQNKDNPKICIQTITIIYKKVNGITLNRVGRRDITWHSNMELLPNMINFLKKMSIEVEIIFNEKFIPKTSLDRKKLAFFCWKDINYTLINNLYRKI